LFSQTQEKISISFVSTQKEEINAFLVEQKKKNCTRYGNVLLESTEKQNKV
jgi:hypothetical protein